MDDPYLSWLILLGIGTVGTIILIVLIRVLKHLLKPKHIDRPSKYIEDTIKEKLAKGNYKRPKVVSRGSKGWGLLENFRRIRPQPHIGSTYNWGQEIYRRQQKRNRAISGRD